MDYNLEYINHSPEILQRCGPICNKSKITYKTKLIAKFPIMTDYIVDLADSPTEAIKAASIFIRNT